MGKTIAVTGVNGYVASTLLPKLQNDPQIDKIIGIDIRPWNAGAEKVSFVRKDVRSKEIADLLQDVDTVYHIASIYTENGPDKETQDINVEGSRNVFRACVEKQVRKVIFVSSNMVYGLDGQNSLPATEQSSLCENKECHGKSLVAAEKFGQALFNEFPDTIFTVLRSGLLFGPKARNRFSKLFEKKSAFLPTGYPHHFQLVSEEDLGQALYLAYVNDLPGVYNVGADDAVSLKWCFDAAGVVTIPAPEFMLSSTAVMAGNTVFTDTAKFKKAAGWQPKYSSEEAFNNYVAMRSYGDKQLTRKLLTFTLKKSGLTRSLLRVLNNLYKTSKIPGIRHVNPWIDVHKNSMSYLPINESLNADQEFLPYKALHDFIDLANVHVIMNKCGCRFGEKCENHTDEIGCLFMGQSALEMPKGLSRRVTREEAHKHVERAVSVGLVPMTGKVRVDNALFLLKDRKKLLSVCFCCHCCCMMRYFKHVPTDQLDGVMPRVEGLEIEVTDDCVGCGKCVETCGWDAISIVDGKAVHNDKCRGCGRCERFCPNHALLIKNSNPQMVEDIKKRILQYTDIR